MKKAEQLAWGAMAGLLVILAILLTGAIIYGFTVFYAAAMLVGAQALVLGLAAWGLMLARQARELNELPPLPTGEEGFRMSSGAEGNAGRRRSNVSGPAPEAESKTIDIGFQRLLVGIAGILLLGLGGLATYLVYDAYRWAGANPDQALPIIGPFTPAAGTPESARYLSEAGLLIGLSMAALYGVLYWITRPRRETGIHGEAAAGNFTLGLTPMAALAVGTLLAYFKVAGASEVTAGIIAAFMLLQGLELIVNAFRSYSSIEELDQDAIDLQATPLGPMLSSIWLSGLRILVAQSVGLTGGKKGDRGVMARMMPRALLAMVVIAIGISCIRVVPPGQVAVLERLGAAPTHAVPGQPNMQMLDKSAILEAGPHLCFPWPIDNLVMIPTEQLQLITVGSELHAAKEWKGIDFQFWTIRANRNESDIEDLFVTGDPAPQILETFVQVRWRVERPELFYSLISHSDFFEKTAGGIGAEEGETKAVTTYDAIIQQCASFAVTRTFAIHSLEEVMFADRREVETHCRDILQEKLDSLGKALGLDGSGIKVDYLTIKDLHPPYWRPDRQNPSEIPIGGQIAFPGDRLEIVVIPQSRVTRGPASAFEYVNSMREFRDATISLAQGEVTRRMTQAQGEADSAIQRAEAYRLDKVARAHGEADRLVQMTSGMSAQDQRYMLKLMEQRQLYATLKDLLEPVSKIVTDPDIKDVQIWQQTDKGTVPVVPGR